MIFIGRVLTGFFVFYFRFFKTEYTTSSHMKSAKPSIGGQKKICSYQKFGGAFPSSSFVCKIVQIY